MFEKFPPRIYSNVNINNYETFEDIERCVHIQDVFDYNRNTLSPSKITRKDQSHLENQGMHVLWFGISSKPSQHSVYGNISFVIRLQTLLAKFYSCRQLYYLETVERSDSVLSRLLFTARHINELKPAVMLDLINIGSPLFQDSCGTYYHLKSIPGYKNGHNLEILIDMPRRRLNDAQWLFDNCRKISVNHEEANTLNVQTQKYRPCICYKYNNRQQQCPTPFNEIETYNHMKRECPTFLDSKKKNSRNKAISQNEETSTPKSSTNEKYNITSYERTSPVSDFRQQIAQQKYIKPTLDSTARTYENSSSYNITSARSTSDSSYNISSPKITSQSPYNITSPGRSSQESKFRQQPSKQKYIKAPMMPTSETYEDYNISISGRSVYRTALYNDVESARAFTDQQAQQSNNKRFYFGLLGVLVYILVVILIICLCIYL